MRYLAICGMVGVLAGAGRARAQELKVGDPAPGLEIAHWVKGGPVELQKGAGKNVYLIEFWATWCMPCEQSVPHLTELQHKYKDKGLVVIGITDEPKVTAKRFVERMGNKMDYAIACDKTAIGAMGPIGKTNQSYMLASGQSGIPTSFIISRDGRIAWIGSPFAGMDDVLQQVIAGTFDIEQAQADDAFARKHSMDLMLALQTADWDKVIEIGKKIADPHTKISSGLRTQLLDLISWQLFTSPQADKQHFQEALHLAKAAYDACGGKNASVLDTYARGLFETGAVQQAVEYQSRAVELADGPMKLELRNTLEEYKKSLASQGG